MTGRRGNGTKYHRLGKPPVQISYRKHVGWQKRWDNIVTEGFDNELSHGTILLPEPGQCHECERIIINGSDHKPKLE